MLVFNSRAEPIAPTCGKSKWLPIKESIGTGLSDGVVDLAFSLDENLWLETLSLEGSVVRTKSNSTRSWLRGGTGRRRVNTSQINARNKKSSILGPLTLVSVVCSSWTRSGCSAKATWSHLDSTVIEERVTDRGFVETCKLSQGRVATKSIQKVLGFNWFALCG